MASEMSVLSRLNVGIFFIRDGSVWHCNVLRGSKYAQNMEEIMNCSLSLANNVFHSSSTY